MTSPHLTARERAAVLLPLNAVLQREGAGSVLSTRIKEMVIIKTSQINGCAY